MDRVNKNSICDDSRVNFRDDACTKLGAENGVSTKKMRFVGADKLHCSVVLFLGNKQKADELIHRKYLEVDGEVVYTKTYERIANPRRCFQLPEIRQSRSAKVSDQGT